MTPEQRIRRDAAVLVSEDRRFAGMDPDTLPVEVWGAGFGPLVHLILGQQVSIEAAEGVTTGISAADRAHTVRTAVAPNAKPEDIVQPGHIFPLMAQPLAPMTTMARSAPTEADFLRLRQLTTMSTTIFSSTSHERSLDQRRRIVPMTSKWGEKVNKG